MHCTTGEAITIGKRMAAQHILLTHFSQKWSRIPEFVIDWSKHKDETEKYENVGIAFDRMAIKIGNMWKLPLMFSAFEAIYRDERERRWIKRKFESAALRDGKTKEPPQKKARVRTELPDHKVLELKR